MGGRLLLGKTLLGSGEMEGEAGKVRDTCSALHFRIEVIWMEWKKGQQDRKAHPLVSGPLNPAACKKGAVLSSEPGENSTVESVRPSSAWPLSNWSLVYSFVL